MADMPSSNEVWSRYLEGRGFTYHSLRPGNYTVRTFCEEHPQGVFVLGTGTHTSTIPILVQEATLDIEPPTNI